MLRRLDRYGFFFYMEPAEAEYLLQRDCLGKVGALVFTDQSLAQLKSKKWNFVAGLIERKFFRAPEVGSSSRLVVFLRRDSNTSND